MLQAETANGAPVSGTRMVPDSSRRRSVTHCLEGAAVPKKRAAAVDTVFLVSFAAHAEQAQSFITRGCHRGTSAPCPPPFGKAGYTTLCIAIAPTLTAHGSDWRWRGSATPSQAQRRRSNARNFRASLNGIRSAGHNRRRHHEIKLLGPQFRGPARGAGG